MLPLGIPLSLSLVLPFGSTVKFVIVVTFWESTVAVALLLFLLLFLAYSLSRCLSRSLGLIRS